MAGCSVFTRPSNISGKLVNVVTDSASNPAVLMAFNVPLVEYIETAWLCNSRANSASPSRLATLIIALTGYPFFPHNHTTQYNRLGRLYNLPLIQVLYDIASTWWKGFASCNTTIALCYFLTKDILYSKN